MKNKVKAGGFVGYMRAQADSFFSGFGKTIPDTVIKIVFAVLISAVIWQTKVQTDGYDDFNAVSVVFLFAAYLFLISSARVHKPSVAALYPVSYRRRTAYNFLCLLTFTLIVFALFVLFILCLELFPMLFAGLLLGIWEPFGLVFKALFTNLAVEVDVYGIIFLVFYVLALFGAGRIYGCLEKRKARCIFAGAFVLAEEALVLLLVNFSDTSAGFRWSSLAVQNFGNLPLAWLWLTVFAVISAGICAVSVYLTVRCEKPKDF